MTVTQVGLDVRPTADYTLYGATFFGHFVGENVYSNVDHRLKEDVYQALLREPRAAVHAAWNFNAVVWHRDGTWFERVSVHKQCVGVWSSESLPELIEHVNATYGRE